MYSELMPPYWAVLECHHDLRDCGSLIADRITRRLLPDPAAVELCTRSHGSRLSVAYCSSLTMSIMSSLTMSIMAGSCSTGAAARVPSKLALLQADLEILAVTACEGSVDSASGSAPVR